MMLSRLQAIADVLDVTFLFGERTAFNKSADDVPGELTPVDWEAIQSNAGIVLHNEGYLKGSMTEDPQGAFEMSYDLKLFLLLPSDFGDTPLQRRPGFERLEPLLMRLLRELKREHTLSGINVVEGINLTDRNLDGLMITLRASAKETTALPC